MQTRRMGTLALILAGTMLVTPAAAQQTTGAATGGDTGTASPVLPAPGADATATTDATTGADAATTAETSPETDTTEATGGEAEPPTEVTEAAPEGLNDVGEGGGAGPLPTNVGGGVPGPATTTADTVGIDSAASGEAEAPEAPGSAAGQEAQAAPGSGPSAMPGGGAMMLDIESFASEIYERGFRQGYLRGMIDTRDRLVSQMQQHMQNRQTEAQPGQSGQAMPTPPEQGTMGQGRMGGMMGQGRMGQDADRGAVIVLPPGMTPQMFLEQLDRMNQGG